MTLARALPDCIPDLTVSKVYYTQVGEIQVGSLPVHLTSQKVTSATVHDVTAQGDPLVVQILLQGSREHVEPDGEFTLNGSNQEGDVATKDNSLIMLNLMLVLKPMSHHREHL